MKKEKFLNYDTLEEYLAGGSNASLKKYHNNRTCYDAYCELEKNLVPVQNTVTEGAMADAIRQSINKCKEQLEKLEQGESQEKVVEQVHQFLASDPVLFLNDHGPEHINKVIEKANEITHCFKEQYLSEFETFILLCAIQIHDIGNILGRAGHERKLAEIFDEKSVNIIVDTPERRIIKSIAMAHGGKLGASKDTISALRSSEPIFNESVRTRLLAGILRFADELADDTTRANRQAMDLGILGTNSQIYHEYSKALHTVTIREDTENLDHKVVLVFELEANDLKTEYQVGNHNKYLLDEIYDRTLKMELERRYCMKFMYPYVNIGRIDVTINIYGDFSTLVKNISFTLEDLSYPEENTSVKNSFMTGISVPSGAELLHELVERGAIHETE